MAEDSKLGMNLGSSSGRVFVADIKGGVVELRNEFRNAKQDLRDMLNMAQQLKSTLSSVRIGGGGGGEGYNPNQIAPDPVFTPPASAGGGQAGGPPISGQAALPGPSGGYGGNIVAWTPNIGSNSAATGSGGTGDFTGNTNLTNFIKDNPAAGVLFASNLASGLVKSPADTVEAQLLMQRTAYFNSAALGGNIGFPYNGAGYSGMGQQGNRGDYNKIVDLSIEMGRRGMVTNDFDAIRALAAAQSIGITGPNVTQAGGQFGSVAMGVAAASNLLPGIGAEGTMRAFSSMQQGRNVNMLRGIGIRLRDEQGNLKPPDQIIEDLWTKICRDYGQAYGTGKKPSEQEVLIGLQPGNSLDSMLDLYFGNDPMAKQLIANGLLFKAKGGGQIGREDLTKLGATTPAANLYADIQAESGRGLAMYAGAGAGGFMLAGNQLLSMSKTMNDLMPTMVAFLTGANAFVTTLLGAGGEAITKLFKLAILMKALPGRAEGGEVGDDKPYIVGEKGPELFIPKSDGVIIPNHLLGTRNRHEGGGVKHGHAGKTLKEAEVRSILKKAGFKEGQELDEAVAIARAESGFRTNAEGDRELARKSNLWNYSIGLMQIRSYDDPNRDPNRDYRKLYDPEFNAKAAYKIYKGAGDWSPWYNSATKLGFKGGGNPSESVPYSDSFYESLGEYGSLFKAFDTFLKGGDLSKKEANTLAEIMGGSSGGMFEVGGTEAARRVQNTYNYNINVKSDNPEKTARLVLKYIKNENMITSEAKK